MPLPDEVDNPQGDLLGRPALDAAALECFGDPALALAQIVRRLRPGAVINRAHDFNRAAFSRVPLYAGSLQGAGGGSANRSTTSLARLPIAFKLPVPGRHHVRE